MSVETRKLVAFAIGMTVVGTSIAALRRRRSRSSFAGKTVLISGGSRGLGLELARCWAEEGATVALCARTRTDLRHAVDELRDRSLEAHGFVCDVTQKKQVDDLIETVVKRWGSLDVLVNNAGIIQVGPVKCMKLNDYEQAMDTHFWGPLHTISSALPHMRRQGGGHIVNIASIGGEISVPHLVPYSASKFALVGLSEGLCAELAEDGIYVTTVCPGLMRTGSPRNALFKGQHRKEYAWFSIAASLPVLSVSSRTAAKTIIHACRQGRPYLAISLPTKFAVRLHALGRGAFTHAMRLVNHVLPAEGGVEKSSRRGSESFSKWSPSALTWLNEKAALKNNEVR